MHLRQLSTIFVLFSCFSLAPITSAQEVASQKCQISSGKERCGLDANLNYSGNSFFAWSQPEKKSKSVCPKAKQGEGHCHLHVVVDSTGAPLVAQGPSGYGPTEFHIAYALPTTVAQPTTIAIVDAYDDPTIENDLNVYSQTYGLPACTTNNGCFKKVNQNGQQYNYPSADPNWALEISLDVEIAHALCQNCQILLVEAQSPSTSNLFKAEDRAVQLGANVISNSFGVGEFSGEILQDIHFIHPGVAIVAASGDSGYGVEYPAASPYVTAVSGTTLSLNPDDTRNSETAWSGAGSGCSAYEPKPNWQQDTGCAQRTVADVSADADPNTGAAIYSSSTGTQSGWYQVGGTSLAAPLIAGVYALANNSSSVHYGSYPYSQTPSLYDIQSGSNGNCGNYLCTAGTGYDGPTGLGTPIGTNGF